jgi:hypothetical protein
LISFAYLEAYQPVSKQSLLNRHYNTIEAGFHLAEKKYRILNKGKKPDPITFHDNIIDSVSKLSRGYTTTLLYLWNKMSQYETTNKLLIYGYSIREAIVMKFLPNTLPNYQRLTEVEYLKTLKDWLNDTYFQQVPAVLDGEFINKFSTELITWNTMKKSDFKLRFELSGYPFKNGFLEVRRNNQQPILRKYSPMFYSGEHVSNFESKPILRDPKNQSELLMDQGAKDLLNVISGGDPLMLNVLRGFCRTCMPIVALLRRLISFAYLPV